MTGDYHRQALSLPWTRKAAQVGLAEYDFSFDYETGQITWVD